MSDGHRSGRSTGRVSCKSTELKPCSVIEMFSLLLLFLAHQLKATCRKTRLDTRNYGCYGNLLSDHGVVERNRVSFLESHGKALEVEYCLSGVFSVIVVMRLPISCVSCSDLLRHNCSKTKRYRSIHAQIHPLKGHKKDFKNRKKLMR